MTLDNSIRHKDPSGPSVPSRLAVEVIGRQPHPSLDFVKVEKNLASFGFFTPSHKKNQGTKKKTIVFNRQSEGQRVEVRAVILPSAAYGLPITSDQDKYLAFQKIITDIRRQKGEVTESHWIHFS